MINPGPDLEINCRAQLSILEACRACNPEIKIIFASTRQIYGRPSSLPVSETHPLNPVDVNKPLRETIESTLNYYRKFISHYV
jgi:UDP-glucose 4-epimerase